MSQTFVIYHRADFDGLFSRAIAERFFGISAQYIGWDYGDPLPEIPVGAELFMIDISIEGMMDWPDLTWIDHHKSAMEKYPECVRGFCIDGVAACRLAWQYFFSHGYLSLRKEDFVERRVTEPLAVRLAGEYDIWDKRDPDTELFQYGLRSGPLSADWWKRLLDLDRSKEAVEQLLQNARALKYSKGQENESIITAFGFTVEFEGRTFLACNAARYNSHLFTAGLKPEHDGCLGFNFDGKGSWRISLYGAPSRPDLDLSPIAVKYGGGGHRQACGFRCTELPFTLPREEIA